MLSMLNARDALREKNSGQILEIMSDLSRTSVPSVARHHYPRATASDSSTFGTKHEIFPVSLDLLRLYFNVILIAHVAG